MKFMNAGIALIITAALLGAGVPLARAAEKPVCDSMQMGQVSPLVTTAASPSSFISSGGVQVAYSGQGGTAVIKGVMADRCIEAKELGSGHVKYNLTSLTISAPTSKNTDVTQLSSLDGLSNATSFALGETYYSLTSGMADVHADETGKVICSEVERRAADLDDPKPECNAQSVAKYVPSRYDDFIHLYPLYGTVLGGDLRSGFQHFNYIDQTLSQHQQSKYPYSASIYVGRIFSFEQAAFLELEFQNAFRDAPSGTLCNLVQAAPPVRQVAVPPPPPPPTVSCASGPIGAPIQSRSSIVTFEYRKVFNSVPMFNNVAFSTVIHRNVQSKVTSVELPLYLFTEPGKGLTSGFSLGYRSDTRLMTGMVFASKPFSVF